MCHNSQAYQFEAQWYHPQAATLHWLRAHSPGTCVAASYRVFQRAAVSCSVLQCSGVLQRIAVCCSGNILRYLLYKGFVLYNGFVLTPLLCVTCRVAVRCNALQRVAACGSVLQRVAACCSVLQW